MSTKPILFNTEMVRAILENRKSVTRRVVKPQPHSECSHGEHHEFIRDDFIEGSGFTGFVCKKCGYGVCGPHFKFPVGTSWIRPPYRPGDILYVRETWAAWSRTMGTVPGLYYKADGNAPDEIKWRPSIHMPREAARIFLRVTDVRVERLQDSFSEHGSTIFHLQREGINIGGQCRACITAYGRPCCSDDESECGALDEVRSEFSDLWDSTIKPADRSLYGWDANPWVWVIEFERCEKPKGD